MDVNHNRRAGFGLVEMMVSTFVFVLVVATATVMFTYFWRNYNFSFDEGRTVATAQYVMDRINAEAREMQVSEAGGYPLMRADDNEVGFFADVDNDGVVEQVRYFLSGSELLRGVVEPTGEPPTYDPGQESVKVVAENIRNSTPVFYYYNESWPGDLVNNPLAVGSRLTQTRLVKVELVVNTSPGNIDDFKIDTEIMLRNLKTN